jgi:hypothetical protein
MDSWYGMNDAFAPLEHREDFLSRFRKQKCVKEELRQPICAIYPQPGIDAPPCRITLGPEGIEIAWRRALERPLVVARREIARLVGMVESRCVTSPLVVVSGGSARNPAVKSRMAALCGQSGVPVVFTDDFDVRITYEYVFIFIISSTSFSPSVSYFFIFFPIMRALTWRVLTNGHCCFSSGPPRSQKRLRTS